jgi:hypothetical protein
VIVLNGTQENEFSRLAVPRLRDTVAILQDHTDPESFLVVDFTQHLRLCRLDRESFQVVSLIDGKRSVQEIVNEAASQTKTRQDSLRFFRLLHSLRAVEF